MTAEHPYAVRHRTHLAGALRAGDVGTHACDSAAGCIAGAR